MRAVLFSAALLLLGSCVVTTAPTTTTTTRPVVVETTTTITENGRSLEVLTCDDAPEEAIIVCEAYDLIQANYVDEVADLALADAAAEGLASLDGTTATTGMVCLVPAQDFVDVCSEAPFEAEDTAEAAEAMVWGMASLALDPNSAYLDARLLDLIEQEQGGEVEGIGALVNTVDTESGEACGIISDTCQIVIASTIQGSPAQASGIEAGDVVMAVDGTDIIGWSIDEVTTTVRGPAGTEVTLTMRRDEMSFEVTITRAAVEVPVVTSEKFGATGYVRFNQFTDNGDEQLREAIFGLMAESIDTLVLDLRDNPGGLLTTAIDVASQFLEGGDVVRTVGPVDSRTYEVNGSVLVPDEIEVVIVVNGGSASASELVSALLQERGRATVVGVNTFGKNTVQQQFDLSNGGALKLTIARWVTPEGLDFGEVGVTPDVFGDFPSDLTAEAVVDLALSIS